MAGSDDALQGSQTFESILLEGDLLEAARGASEHGLPPQIEGYEFHSKLGVGAFGEVWSAIQRSTGQEVAVKILHRVTSEYRTEVARLSAVAEHPHVIALLDANLDDVPPYLVMPLMAQSLGSMSKVPMDLSKVEIWLRQIAEALRYIHSKAILHCDLKPDNILLDSEGNARIGDFGQAHILGEDSGVRGTLGYIAPEQTALKTTPDVGWDIYALGATFYRILTGQHARATTEDLHSLSLESDTATRLSIYRELLQKRPLESIRNFNPRVPQALAAIVEHCLENDPSKRYGSMDAILEDLRRWRSGEPLLCRKPWRTFYLLGAYLRKYRVVAAAAMVILAVAGASYYQILRSRDETVRQLGDLEFSRGLEADRAGGGAEGFLWKTKALTHQPDNEAWKMATRWFPYRLEAILPHDDKIVSADLSEDGSRLLTASSDGMARVWDTSSGELAFSPIRHESPLKKAVFSADGQRFLTAWNKGIQIWSTSDGTPIRGEMKHESIYEAALAPNGRRAVTCDWGNVRLWDCDFGTFKDLWPERQGYINSIAFSPDSTVLVTASHPGNRALTPSTVRLWDTVTGQMVWAIQFKSSVTAATFSSDGKLLALGSHDGIIQIWDSTTGASQALMEAAERVASLAFSNDGTQLVTISYSGWVQVWNCKNGKLLAATRYPGAISDKSSVMFCPDGTTVLIAGQGQARLWHPLLSVDSDPATEPATGLMMPPMMHAGEIVAALCSHDSQRVFTASEDRTARVWQLVPHPGQVMRHRQAVRSVAFDPSGSYLASGSDDGLLQIWSVASGQLQFPPIRHEGSLHEVCFNPRINNRVMTSTAEGQVSTWNMATGMPVSKTMVHEAKVERLAFSPDGRQVATSSYRDPIRVWNTETGEVECVLPAESRAYSVDFAPDGERVVGSYTDGTTVWDIASRRPVARWGGGGDIAKFRPDGMWVATSGHSGHILNAWTGAPRSFFSTTTGSPETFLLVHNADIHAITFDTMGKRLVTTARDGTARIWGTETGNPLTPFMKVNGTVDSVTFSSDGRWLLTQGPFAQIWDTQSGALLSTGFACGGETLDAKLSPTGHCLATSSADGTVRLWNLDIDWDLSPQTLALSAQVWTGLRLDRQGDVEILPLEEWRELKDRLSDLIIEHREVCRYLNKSGQSVFATKLETETLTRLDFKDSTLEAVLSGERFVVDPHGLIDQESIALVENQSREFLRDKQCRVILIVCRDSTSVIANSFVQSLMERVKFQDGIVSNVLGLYVPTVVVIFEIGSTRSDSQKSLTWSAGLSSTPNLWWARLDVRPNEYNLSVSDTGQIKQFYGLGPLYNNVMHEVDAMTWRGRNILLSTLRVACLIWTTLWLFYLVLWILVGLSPACFHSRKGKSIIVEWLLVVFIGCVVPGSILYIAGWPECLVLVILSGVMLPAVALVPVVCCVTRALPKRTSIALQVCCSLVFLLLGGWLFYAIYFYWPAFWPAFARSLRGLPVTVDSLERRELIRVFGGTLVGLGLCSSVGLGLSLREFSDKNNYFSKWGLIAKAEKFENWLRNGRNCGPFGRASLLNPLWLTLRVPQLLRTVYYAARDRR